VTTVELPGGSLAWPHAKPTGMKKVIRPKRISDRMPIMAKGPFAAFARVVERFLHLATFKAEEATANTPAH
jgi:hypothetical protein